MSMRNAIVSTICAAFFALGAAHAQNDSSDRAHRIFELTNQDRVAHGLPQLHWDASLANAAQAHAQWMASEGTLSHQYPGEPDLTARAAQAGAHFQAIAENIATAWNEDAVENAWMHSPPHRANILDPRMNALGVGVVERHGTLYAVEDFANIAEALSPAQIERKVGALLRNEGVDPSAPRDAAAFACTSNSGYPKGEAARLILRFETPDLTQLPSGTAAQIRSGGYRSASVASCSTSGTQSNFTMYRVAIVLY
jgi:hypothetical protein